MSLAGYDNVLVNNAGGWKQKPYFMRRLWSLACLFRFDNVSFI